MLTTFYMTMIKLAGNHQPENEADLEAVLEQSHEATSTLRTRTRLSAIHLYLYRSDVSRALIRFESIWPRYEKSMLLRIRMTRIDLLEVRGPGARWRWPKSRVTPPPD